MDARQKTSDVVAKTLLMIFALIMVAIFLTRAQVTTSVARAQGERILVNRHLKDVPIRIKVKKEKENSFKTLENGGWVREFELEFTNTGDKPIYFVFLDLVTDVKLGDRPLIFTLQYGRSELGDIITKASDEDVPIKPGETHVFKIHPGQVPAWERSVREGRQAEATRLEVALQMLSFGDGTGYFVNEPYPPARKQRSSLNTPCEQPNKSGPYSLFEGLSGRLSTEPGSDAPANLLPANFLSSMSSAASFSAQNPAEDGCLFDDCVRVIAGLPEFVCYNCPNQNRPTVFSGGGVCTQVVFGALVCELGNGEEYLCQRMTLNPCGTPPPPQSFTNAVTRAM